MLRQFNHAALLPVKHTKPHYYKENTMKTIIRKTPNTMYQPVGKYSHTTIIPAGMDTYVFSGQIGIRGDGSFPTYFNDEVQQLFTNIKVLLDTRSGFEKLDRELRWT